MRLQKTVFFYNDKERKTMKTLDTKELRVGMRVVKITGERRGDTGLVRTVNVEENTFSLLFDGDAKATLWCDPKKFEIRIATPTP